MNAKDVLVYLRDKEKSLTSSYHKKWFLTVYMFFLFIYREEKKKYPEAPK